VELDKSTMLGVTVLLGRTVTAVLLLIQMAAQLRPGADTMGGPRCCAPIRPIRNSMRNRRLGARHDENVPQGPCPAIRPKVTVTASGGGQFINQLTNGSSGKRIEERGHKAPTAAGATLTQTLFNGNQTANKTRAAESQVLGAREGLRLLEAVPSCLAASHGLYGLPARWAAVLEVQRKQHEGFWNRP